MNVLTDSQFAWFLTAAVGLVAAAWLVYDAINLVRLRGSDRADPAVRDKHFGYVVGMVIGVIGLVGVLRFHGVL
jgi:small-conductance mechanosensitive channel